VVTGGGSAGERSPASMLTARFCFNGGSTVAKKKAAKKAPKKAAKKKAKKK
jgi:hypothetical protein